MDVCARRGALRRGGGRRRRADQRHARRRHGVDFRRVPLRDLIASLENPGTGSHYVMAPTWNLPEQFQTRPPPARYCADAWHLRAKFWVGKSGTVTPMHRDVPHNLNVHLTGRKRWLLLSTGRRGACTRAGCSRACRTSPRSIPNAPTTTRHPRFRGKRRRRRHRRRRRDALHPARLVASHALARRRRCDQLLVGRSDRRRRRARIGDVQAAPQHPPRRVGRRSEAVRTRYGSLARVARAPGSRRSRSR